MSSRLSHKDLQQILRDNMGGYEYSFSQVYTCYMSIMNRDHFIKNYKPMSAESLRHRLKEWSDDDSGWLVMEGSRKDAIYHVRIENTSLKMSHLYAKAMKKLGWRKYHTWQQ